MHDISTCLTDHFPVQKTKKNAGSPPFWRIKALQSTPDEQPHSVLTENAVINYFTDSSNQLGSRLKYKLQTETNTKIADPSNKLSKLKVTPNTFNELVIYATK